MVCSDPDLTLPPASIPPDTCKLRLERTAIRRVPGETFRPLSRLEQLWLPYNALSELSALMLRGLRAAAAWEPPGHVPLGCAEGHSAAAAAGPAGQSPLDLATRGCTLPGEPYFPGPVQ